MFVTSVLAGWHENQMLFLLMLGRNSTANCLHAFDVVFFRINSWNYF